VSTSHDGTVQIRHAQRHALGSTER